MNRRTHFPREMLRVLLCLTALLGLAFGAQAANTLSSNQNLTPGQYLESTNTSYRFNFQTDGNLVVRRRSDSVALWASGTNGRGGTRLTMQSDGNLVLYTSANVAVWATNTVGSGGNRAVMEDSGNFAIFNASNARVWSTNTGTEVGTKIAFIGDTNAGTAFQNVLNLIKNERAQLTVTLGDTVYAAGLEDDWDTRVRNTLGNSDPALVVVGNHDVDDGSWSTIRSFGEARLGRQSAVSCTGTYGERATCRLNNVFIVVSGVGTRGTQADQESFIANSLANAPAGAWRICAWHKNQRLMQVGGKTDEVGWTAYENCRNRGAIIMTGHEHSYSRTHLLSSMQNQTVADSTSPYTVINGRTIAVVSGLGGVDIRDQELTGNWWAKVYTSTQGAKHAALFGTFYSDRAEFYLKNIDGTVIETFTVLKGY
jgi:predicted phosphodiesterase